MTETIYNSAIAQRFRGYLPIVVDVETGGFDARKDALLEIAATTIAMDEQGMLYPAETNAYHLIPFKGANIDPKALEFNGIDPDHPFRQALPEEEGLKKLFTPIRKAISASGCKRAILVGHNAFFDLGFVNAAAQRCGIKRNPFHPFSTFDTVSLAGLAYGQTVLAKAAQAAGLEWDSTQAHSAIYDTEQTARLFCIIINQWQQLSNNKP
ncbi:MAG: ribonuclease T [Candidatus Thiodiazotropha sp.]|jgi:ribonuclease T